MNGNLPIWIQRLLGIDASAGEGVAWSIQRSWPWPPWLTLLLLCGLAAYVAWAYLGAAGRSHSPRMVLAGLRLAAIGLLLLMIAQVSLSLQRTGLPCVALLLDDSRSMSIVDHYDEPQETSVLRRVRQAGFEEPSRWNLARTLLTENDGSLLKSIADRYRLRPYFLCGPSSPGEENLLGLQEDLRRREPSGETTRLGAGIQQILGDLRGTPPAAILLLSDGINTDGPALSDAAQQARNRGVPLFAVGLGDDRPQRDLRLSDLLVDDLVFVGDVVSFDFKLTGMGCKGRKVEILLRRAGRQEPLARVEAVVGPDDHAQPVQLTYCPVQEGQLECLLEVAPLEGELDTGNNRIERKIEVRKQEIRVLLADSVPRYEFRYLRNLLARDETVQLRTLLQEADLEHAEQDATALRLFPVRRDELMDYDVLILGDLNPALLSEGVQRNIADYVLHKAHGGALILIAGPRYMPLGYRGTPLAALMPLDPASARYPDPDQRSEEFRVLPTDLGRASPAMQLGNSPAETAAIWGRLPPLYWLLEARDLKSGAHVLAEAWNAKATVPPPDRSGDAQPHRPLIVTHFVGAGRVLMHLTDETWRWRWRVGDAYFARYWVQTIRYLARSKRSQASGVELEIGRREYRRGEDALLCVRFSDEARAPAEDDGVTVVVEHQGGKTHRVKLQRVAMRRGWFETTLAALPPGHYHAWIAVPSTEGRAPAADFTVVEPPGEFERTCMASAELQQAAGLTKGRFYTLATAKRLLDELPEGRPVPIELLPSRPLWNRWPLLLFLMLLLTAEWTLRKWLGMR